MSRSIPTLAGLRAERDAILQIAARYGAANIRVFGSVARNEATADSDIDLLVDQDTERLSKIGRMELSIELEKLLGRSVDVATEEELVPAIHASVLKDAVPL